MEQKNLILGFDFGEKYSQFCCYDRGTHTAVSIPVKEGEEAVEFPTAIAKKRNVAMGMRVARFGTGCRKICSRGKRHLAGQSVRDLHGIPHLPDRKPGLHAGRSPWHVPSRSIEDDRHRAPGPADPGDDDHHGPSDPSICGKCA